MQAAVLYEYGKPPRFQSFPDPTVSDDEVLVHVSAAALNPSTRVLASGKHYASPSELPVVCGVEGVGRLDDGRRVFFGVLRPPYGSMCERTCASRAFCWQVPEGLDDVIAASLPNPGLSSWLPLITTGRLSPGETVLILGATGVAGRLAIQIAKHLGAGKVVAAGRNDVLLRQLPSLGADCVIDLKLADTELIESFSSAGGSAGFDVVLDFLWGHPAEALITAMRRKGFPASRAGTRLIQIGDAAGAVISLPAQALRSSGLTITGSGSMPPMNVLSAAFQKLMNLAASGGIQIEAEPVPLADIEKAWIGGDKDGRRLVIVP